MARPPRQDCGTRPRLRRPRLRGPCSTIDEPSTVELYAYDSGGDDGTTYEAADEDNDPKKATTAPEDQHFVVAGKKPPVATLTFTRK